MERVVAHVLLVVVGVLVVQRACEILQPLVVSVVLATALWPWVPGLPQVTIRSFDANRA
jgi:predicted PurR-regulated permease PerM